MQTNTEALQKRGQKELEKIETEIKMLEKPPEKRIKISPIVKEINQIKSFWEDGKYNPTWIAKKLKTQREFVKDVLECLEVGDDPEKRIVKSDQMVTESDELMIQNYFQRECNIGKSIKA